MTPNSRYLPRYLGDSRHFERPLSVTTDLIHIAFSTGSDDQVDSLTHWLDHDGYVVVDGPRHTGDGYYESVVLDPDGNRVEITS